jgi:cell division protein FtsQ
VTAPTVDRPRAASVLPPRRRRGRIVRVLLLVLAAAAVAVIVWAVWFSRLFAVDQVRVIGVDGARADAVLAAAAIPTGVPLARLDTAPAERALAAVPWIASAEVRRGWPHEVVLAIVPRVPIAITTQGRGVDAAGVAFDVDGAAPAGLPQVDASGASLPEAMAVIAELPADLARRVASVSATTIDDVTLHLRSGVLVRWGSSDQGPFKAQVLAALMRRPAQMYDVSAPEVPTTYRP